MSKRLIPPMPDRQFIDNHDFMFQWCCKCGTRHIWHYTIHRGKKSDDDFVEINGLQDPIATKLRKFWDKHHKKGAKHASPDQKPENRQVDQD